MHRSRRRPPKPKPITITGAKQFDERGAVIPVTVRRTGDISDLRDRYGYNLPPIPHVTAGGKVGDRLNTQTYQSNDYWHNHGSSPPVVRLLFTGRLPLNFFTEICYGRKVIRPHLIHHQAPTVQREKELWEPKGDIKEECKHVLVAVHEARHRQRKILEQVRLRAKAHQKQVESVLLRQRDMKHRGLTTYLNKMDREAERLTRKWKKYHSEVKDKTPETDVFITEDGTGTPGSDYDYDY